MYIVIFVDIDIHFPEKVIHNQRVQNFNSKASLDTREKLMSKYWICCTSEC